MTLLELLRQELPKRGGWPEGATKATSYWFIPGVHFWDDNDFRVDCSDLTARELGEAIVTREQYEATGWDGANLPPVGCRIEYTCKQFSSHKPSIEEGCWYGGTIIAYHDGFVWTSDNGLRPLDNTLFRPLRTEAERAIDEMVQLSCVSVSAAKILYDAGYRKG